MKKNIFILLLILVSLTKGFGQKNEKQIDDYNLEISNLIDNGEYALALKKTDTLELFSKAINYKKGIAESYNLKGVINRDKSNLKVALEFYLQALSLFEELKIPKRIAGMQNNIGLIYAEIKEYRTALAYYFKAEKILNNKKDGQNLAVCYNNIATCYQNLKQFSSAQTYLNKSLELRNAIHDTMGMAMAYHNIGINHQLVHENDSALNYFHKSLSYLGTGNENIGHAYNYLEIGNSLLQNGKIKEAEPYLLKSLKISQKNGLIAISNSAYEHLYKLAAEKKDYKNAFQYQNLFLSSAKSIENDESTNELLKKELEYDFNKKREVQRIESENRQAISDAEIAAQKKMTTYAILALIVLSGLILFVFRSYNEKRKANSIISKQKEIVEHKQKEIVDSINYAKYIQNALLPDEKIISKINSFILFQPKDIVSGDFYWIHENKSNSLKHSEIYVAAADCTGHGVPGAIMSVICNNALNEVVNNKHIHQPDLILNEVRNMVTASFKKQGESTQKDGMDIALVRLIETNGKTTLQFAGANNPLWIIRKGQPISTSENVIATGTHYLMEIKADKQPIGNYEKMNPFTLHEMDLQSGDTIYSFSDGYADQFGGSFGKKMKYKPLKDLLLSIQDKNMNEQHIILFNAYQDWKRNFEQIDDVCMIGVRI